MASAIGERTDIDVDESRIETRNLDLEGLTMGRMPKRFRP